MNKFILKLLHISHYVFCWKNNALPHWMGNGYMNRIQMLWQLDQ